MSRQGQVGKDPQPADSGDEITALRRRVAALLRANHGVRFCPLCLAERLAVAAENVEAALAELVRSPQFREERWFCFDCHRSGPVLRALS